MHLLCVDTLSMRITEDCLILADITSALPVKLVLQKIRFDIILLWYKACPLDCTIPSQKVHIILFWRDHKITFVHLLVRYLGQSHSCLVESSFHNLLSQLYMLSCAFMSV